MRVIHEADAVEVDHSQIWGVSPDLADVNDLVNFLLLFSRSLEGSFGGKSVGSWSHLYIHIKKVY